jgi:hypothetical protein
MKVFSVLLIIVFLFTGAKPVSHQPPAKVSTYNYEELPDRLNQLSEKMESLSHKVQALK